MAKVFISYSSKDQEFVDLLDGDLRKNGIETWVYKSQIKIGEDIPSRISEGIAESDFILVVFSEDFLNSEWCKKEVSGAIMKEIESKKRVVLPLKVGECDIPEILKSKKYADFKEWREQTDIYKVQLGELLRSIDPDIKAAVDVIELPSKNGGSSYTASVIHSYFVEMQNMESSSSANLSEMLRQNFHYIEEEWIPEYRAHRANLDKRTYLFEHLKKLVEPVVGWGCFFISKEDFPSLEKCLRALQILMDLPGKAQIDGEFYETIRRQPYDGLTLLFYGWSFYSYTFEAFKIMKAIFDERIVDTEGQDRGVSCPLIGFGSVRHMEAFDTHATKSFDFVLNWIQNDSLLSGRCNGKEEVQNSLLQLDFLAGLYFALLVSQKKLPETNTWYFPNFRRFYQRRYIQILRDLYHQTRRGQNLVQDLFGLDFDSFKTLWPACADYLNGMRVDVLSAHTLDRNFFSK